MFFLMIDLPDKDNPKRHYQRRIRRILCEKTAITSCKKIPLSYVLDESRVMKHQNINANAPFYVG